MARLPRIAELEAASAGTGFYPCARKERRTGRGGPFLALLLQDGSGVIGAKAFQNWKIRGGAAGMPTTLLVDPAGGEIGTVAGPAEWASEDAVKLVSAALQR